MRGGGAEGHTKPVVTLTSLPNKKRILRAMAYQTLVKISAQEKELDRLHAWGSTGTRRCHAQACRQLQQRLKQSISLEESLIITKFSVCQYTTVSPKGNDAIKY